MAPNPLKVGVTGGIGTGKSTVCKMFMILGIPVYNADNRAKALMSEDDGLVADMIKAFGPDTYNKDGSLNRTYLSERVFGNADELLKINALVHPKVTEDFNRWVATQFGVPYVLKEAALLFESGSYRSMDKIIAVTAPLQQRILRVLLRDYHRTRKQVEEIIRNQMPEKQKVKQANFVILNDDKHFLIDQVLKIHDFLRA